MDLSPFVNADLTRYTRGAAYPQKGGYITVNGVVFHLAAAPEDGRTGVVQAFSDPALNPGVIRVARIGHETAAGSENVIPIHEHNVVSVDVLMNSAYGHCGEKIGELIFISGKGKRGYYPLIEGVNIRDHNNYDFCNAIAHFEGEANYGNVRLDFQRIELPKKFETSLDAIVLRGFRKDAGTGAPFIAAITLNISNPHSVSTIQYGKPLMSSDPQQSCLADANPCTPADASITKEGAASYRITLPANLVLGAAIPNPNHRPVKVQIESGVVCLNAMQAFRRCFSNPPAVSTNVPAGAAYLNPSFPAGALIWVNIGSETVFSVNGKLSDEGPIPGSNGKLFRDYQGGVSFLATIQ